MPDLKTCEYCKKSINAGLTICPFCGGQVQAAVEQLPPQCPRCRKPFKLLLHEEEEYELCPECGGLWLDRGEFHQATREAVVYKEESFKEEYRRSSIENSVTYIPCVRCGKVMNRKNFAGISGVIIDECSKHGVWLDAGELEKLRHFIADGGIDRAQDREIRNNRVELERLAMEVDRIDFTQRLIHFWNLKRWMLG